MDRKTNKVPLLYVERKKTLDIAEQDLLDLANKTVYYILVADQRKYAIKKSGILKSVFQNENRRCFANVLNKSNEILQKVFGMELLSIHSNSSEYILINKLEQNAREFIEISPIEKQKQGLIFYLLTLIFMNGNVMSEEIMWESLKPLGIDVESSVEHSIFGDVRRYITVELVKQMYLEYKTVNKDPPEAEFRWGQRAIQEVDKRDILPFVCKITNTKPEEWIMQYKDAHGKDDEES